MRSRLVRDSHAAEFLKRLPDFLLDCPKYAAFIVISFINNVSTKTFEKTIVALCLGYLFVALGYGRKVKIIFQISISGTKWCMRKNISTRPKTKKRSQNFNTAPSGRVIIWYFRSIDGWPRCLRGLGTKKSPNYNGTWNSSLYKVLQHSRQQEKHGGIYRYTAARFAGNL